jgi:hypothetical protein
MARGGAPSGQADGADISTCTFSGDMAGVPVRVTGPADDDLCSLFAVAEERFQRRFTVKDLIDLVLLADALHHRLGDEVVDVVVSNARTLCLAPELRQLIKKASTWVPLPGAWPEVAHRLQPLAAEEKALRRASRPGVARLRIPAGHRVRPAAADSAAPRPARRHRPDSDRQLPAGRDADHRPGTVRVGPAGSALFEGRRPAPLKHCGKQSSLVPAWPDTEFGGSEMTHNFLQFNSEKNHNARRADATKDKAPIEVSVKRSISDTDEPQPPF